MTTTMDQTRHAASHYAAPGRVVAALLVVLLALPLTGCRDSGSGIDPAPLPAPTQEYIPPEDSNGFVDEPYVYPDEPTPYGDYTEEPYVYPEISRTPTAITPTSRILTLMSPGVVRTPARSRATRSVRRRGRRCHRRT